MLDRIRRYIDSHHLIPEASRVVVGVSGGVDSMILLHLLHGLEIELVAAHVNYGLRGEASDEDEAHVVRYCNERGIPFEVLRTGKAFKDEATGRSFQEFARERRYRFFAELAEEKKASRIAVGHHLDDQVETVLLHLIRGSGVEGISGMAPTRPIDRASPVQLVRPLLAITREEILAYALENGLVWREDESNATVDYDRNRVRHRLLPVLREYFGEASIRNVARSAEYLEGYYRHTIEPDLQARFALCSTDSEEPPSLSIEALSQQPEVWKSRLILEALHRWMPDAPYTATQALAIRQLLEAQVGRKVLLEVGKVWRERERLVFKCAAPENREEPRSLDLYPGDRFSTPEGVLTVAAESYLPDLPLDAGPDRVLLDAAKIAFPLQVRRWQSGDRLEPLGMRGHKKVSDLLTDERIPSYRRSGIRVVTSNQEIVWVVGVRIADRVKVNPDTVRVVRLTFERNPDSVKKD